MSNINSISISGNLTRAPYVNDNGEFASCDVAVNRSYLPNGKSEWVEEVVFLRVVGFNGQAKRIATLDKGDPVFAQGRIEADNYTNKDGIDVKGVRIVAAQVESGRLAVKTADTPDNVPAAEGDQGELPVSADADTAE